jgi:branched-chain amino acid transport system ATP-binding protein
VKPLQVDNLTKSFGGLQTLCGISMSVEEGERRVILGPNGAGKTTLFHTVSGWHSATSGSIKLFGKEVTHLASHKRVRLGLGRTFQITNLFPELTVFDTLFIGIQAQEKERLVFFWPAKSCRKIVSRVEEVIEQWNLNDVRDEQVRHLSYGQQRQLEVILAMATRPKLLLLDEPTAGLSPAETTSMTHFLHSLGRDITILMIEHDMDVAFEIADRIAVLYFGKILTEGLPKEVQNDPRVLDIYLGEQHSDEQHWDKAVQPC